MAATEMALPTYIDGTEQRFGIDIYERMMRDPVIGPTVDVRIDGALDPGIRPLPAIPPRPDMTAAEAKDQQKAVEVCQFVCHAVSYLEVSLEEFAREMMLAISFGAQVAEKVAVVPTTGPLAGEMVLGSVRVKPRKTLVPVVTASMSVLGYLKADYYSGSTAAVDMKRVIPREKFAVLTYGRRCGDPRGMSVLERAYNTWWIKTKLWPEFFKYMMRFGTPSLWATAPEEAMSEVPDIDETGAPMMRNGMVVKASPVKVLRKALELFFQNGSILAMEGGSKIGTIESSGDGRAYQAGIDILDREMVRAIRGETRTTMESRYGSKADSGTAQDLSDVTERRDQRWVSEMIRRDIFFPLVLWKFGEDAARRYTPRVQISRVAKTDFAKAAAGVAQLYGVGYLDDGQLPGVDEMLDLPERDMKAREARRIAEIEAQRVEASNNQRAYQPLSG